MSHDLNSTSVDGTTTSAMPATPAMPAMPATPATQPAAMRAATQKSGSGAIGVVGPLLAILLLALGVLLLRDALVAAGIFSGKQWASSAVSGLQGFAPVWWLIPVGVVVVLIGVWLVVTALRPRSRKTLPLTSQTGVFLHTRDVARLASGAAADVDGVLGVSSTATRRKVTVSVQATGHGSGGSGLRESVEAAVTERLSALQSPPRVAVAVRTPKEN
ncbi:DUF6286 domain-containing protein [Kineococcus sp. NBC_00420]|uniref:DUF6286 domain-containing protein n=1 Tax=Kineococcus sp. NBC_00420 TaxID=2903564 RepID=UPI002E24FC53